MENQDKAREGICIVSFDGGGPGSLSQLRMLDELMLRLAFKPGVKVDELRPADYFDLMGGVGFGGLVALLLGRLRMTTSQAMDELAAIGTTAFPEGDDMVTREVNMARLRGAIESMLVRHGHPVDIQLHDSSENRSKVVVFAAPTVATDHCHAFRTYPAPRKCLECTFIDAACAAMAMPKYFSSVAIGSRWRKQRFAGIPHGFDNPMREVLKESQLVFGETNPVSLVLSLGSGQKVRPSDLDQHATRSSSIRCDGVARDLQYQLQGVAEYLRLNVDNGMKNIELDDWSKLGSIETYTNVYLEMNPITKYIDKACKWLRQRNGSITLGQLNGTDNSCAIRFHSERLENYLKMEFKEMKDVMEIERITLIDAIGRPIRIPIEFCLTYPMLLDMINLYFKYKKAPGSDFVERGDYRLVHGDHKNIMGQMEWTRIDKAGLKVEMSMILRTHNQNSERCPSCRTPFEGRDVDGWAQCLSCSTQFQVETQVQVEPEEDTTQSDEELVTELVAPAVEPESRQPLMRERPNDGEAVQLQFRLISVINSIAVPSSRLHSQSSARCSSCSTSFEGRAIEGCAQCLSCSTHFRTETHPSGETWTGTHPTWNLLSRTTAQHNIPISDESPFPLDSRSLTLGGVKGSHNISTGSSIPRDKAVNKPTFSRHSTSKKTGNFDLTDLGLHMRNVGAHGLRLLRHYGGNTLEAQRRTANKLGEYRELHNQSPITSIGPQGPRGGESQLHWKCNICERIFDTFQKVAVHVTSAEWGLANWKCLETSCGRVYQSRNELVRHKNTSHPHASPDEFVISNGPFASRYEDTKSETHFPHPSLISYFMNPPPRNPAPNAQYTQQDRPSPRFRTPSRDTNVTNRKYPSPVGAWLHYNSELKAIAVYQSAAASRQSSSPANVRTVDRSGRFPSKNGGVNFAPFYG